MSENNKVWFTSDLHFGHKNIIRFCDRPFREYNSFEEYETQSATDPQVAHMNESILANINEKVGIDDELWILGDIAMGNVDYTIKLVERITCQNVVIVAGNHDRCHPYNGEKHAKWISRYEDLHNVSALHLTNTTFTFPDTLLTVNVSHFPYEAWENSYITTAQDRATKKDKYAQWRLPEENTWLLCGHVHEKWRQKGNQINVGIDAWGGYPVSSDELLSLIEQGENDLPRIAWVK